MNRRTLAILAVVAAAFTGAMWWALRTPALPHATWKPDGRAIKSDRDALGKARAALVARPEGPGGPDIAVIVLDTTRADHVGIYGYAGKTTPGLDGWARTGARVFRGMVSDAPWTVPAHASLFTGVPPATHGADTTPAGEVEVSFRLPEAATTVAERLRDRGYRTLGVAANTAFLAPKWGLSQGFDLWMCTGLQKDRRRTPYLTADRVSRLARELVAGKGDEPTFLFVNFMDPHAPWVVREAFLADGQRVPRQALPFSKLYRQTYDALLAGGTVEPAVRKSWIDAYDAELRFMDNHLKALLGDLDGFEYVFVLGDHGEYLGEHGLLEHSKDVHEEVLRVPLVIRGAGYERGFDDRPIQTHDVASMILAAAGAPADPAMEVTVDLQVSEVYWTRHRDLKKPYGKRFDRIRRAFRLGTHKLILGTDGSVEAYDLAVDPGESNDLAAPDWLPELQARADAWLAAHPAAWSTGSPAAGALPTEEDDMNTLRALGYVD